MTIIQEIRAHDGGRAYRTAEFGAVDADKRTVELAFSSESEVRRWFGVEILSHAPEAVVLDRMQDGAALLLEHDTDKQIGVVESVSIDSDRRGRAVVRFGRSALAEEVFQDVQDGIRRHVSVGYLIHEIEKTGERDGEDIFTVTRWEPFEVSLVSVPADTSVGVGRKLDAEGKKETHQPEKTEVNMTEKTEIPAASVDHTAEIRKAAEAERARTRSILEMGEKYQADDLARDAVKDGLSVADFQRSLLDHVNSRVQKPLADQAKATDIGMTDKEARNFSLVKVIRALTEPTDRRAQQDAAFEFEASRAAADKLGKNTDRFVIPSDVLTRAINTSKTGTNAGDTGGYSIATDLLAQSFIDILRNRATIMQLGTPIGGLVGNIDIPKQVAAAQGYWIGEDADAVESNLELGQISMTPKTVAAYSEITRKLLKQSSLDIEALVRADLAKALALTIDKAGYYGTGSSAQPTGIANATGINAVAFAADVPTFAELVQMETEIAVDNADVRSMAYVFGAGMRGSFKTALKFSGLPGTIWEDGGTVNGYRTEITNQIEAGDVFMGNFNDLLIGMWGGLELMVDPYSNSKKGRLRVVVFQDVDFALRRVESFCLGRKPATQAAGGEGEGS
ncbi:phage major capsid protein (plasmid) [Roseomonas marmotae]|uniref:phage major capsid protein n=1 Tax=Roseomonas marmotae TaxID=2768161 RepID=UPI001AD69179|nr:phage major capsid protein [Roseomonas marmotae]QTI81490.1 phage major capsid protein [Roseomonas marmotae]